MNASTHFSPQPSLPHSAWGRLDLGWRARLDLLVRIPAALLAGLAVLLSGQRIHRRELDDPEPPRGDWDVL